MRVSSILLTMSCGVTLLLGVVHLAYTFIGTRLDPRASDCRAAMESTTLVLTRETTIWRAWIGFNASHAFGAILFGLVYGYLAIFRPDVLFGSLFLLAVGLTLLLGYAVLGKLYWFRVPYRAILAATFLYCAALVGAAFGIV